MTTHTDSKTLFLKFTLVPFLFGLAIACGGSEETRPEESNTGAFSSCISLGASFGTEGRTIGWNRGCDDAGAYYGVWYTSSDLPTECTASIDSREPASERDLLGSVLGRIGDSGLSLSDQQFIEGPIAVRLRTACRATPADGPRQIASVSSLLRRYFVGKACASNPTHASCLRDAGTTTDAPANGAAP